MSHAVFSVIDSLIDPKESFIWRSNDDGSPKYDVTDSPTGWTELYEFCLKMRVKEDNRFFLNYRGEGESGVKQHLSVLRTDRAPPSVYVGVGFQPLTTSERCGGSSLFRVYIERENGEYRVSGLTLRNRLSELGVAIHPEILSRATASGEIHLEGEQLRDLRNILEVQCKYDLRAPAEAVMATNAIFYELTK